ncbi:hypothetical protein DEO72_LG9g1202 [Vigna unguiculata]|uniref:Putative plant transposon protein domain-containing protein n=1 Tax=Vigna unguiculata TaxID=3917 RepID=A0A4D6N021_VIGUN|nr:hypothetical protein DEO72_LG9g1202 [Vigna unguiculata]
MASSSNPKRMKNVVGNPSKGKKRKERIHSHYFFTKDNEDRFQVVMQRKFVAKRKVILKPGEVNEFQLELIRRGWERLGSYPSTLSVTLVKEFYANAKVTTSAAPTFLSYVREKRVPFDVDTINEFLGTQLADDMECQFSVLDDEGMAPRELIQALYLAGEGFHRGTIQRGSLHPLARFWLAFVHANISPCSHVSDLMEGRATILYTILTGRVMDVGHFIANEIHWCANAAGKAALGHNSLITHLCSLAGVDISMASSSNPKRMKNVVGNPSKGKKRKERIHSHYFFTKDNEDRFQVVMQRKFVAKRKVILKPGEVNEFQLELIRRGWERLGSYPSTLSVTLVKEFYANAKVTTSAAPTFLSYVREKRVPFDVDTINEFLGTQLADDMECQFSVLDDEGMAPRELIQALYLAGEGFHRGTIQRGSLHPLARFWSSDGCRAFYCK